ncbi:MAG: hypothetical protein BMS9Abin05_2442 [Rhodothermia bacterium]|nr:MAG: hypothetical protein BMS9Abin05_2442 [Rhodothermia bacterium]
MESGLRRAVIILPITFLMFFSTSQTAAGIDRMVEADTTEVLAAVEAFHSALTRGDSVAVAALLLPDVLLSERSNVESKEHYLSGHFRGDSAYLGAMTREQLSIRVTMRGEAAWVVSRTRLHGNFRDREMDSISVETVVLTRNDGRWLIAAIHWSSGRRG